MTDCQVLDGTAQNQRVAGQKSCAIAVLTRRLHNSPQGYAWEGTDARTIEPECSSSCLCTRHGGPWRGGIVTRETHGARRWLADGLPISGDVEHQLRRAQPDPDHVFFRLDGRA